MQFGRWTVVGPGPKDTTWGRKMMLVRCECGTERAVALCRLKGGTSRSCGCLAREMARTPRNVRHGHAAGGRLSREYRSWAAMKQRCHDPNAENFSRYGGRGILVCDEWRESFDAFLAHIGPAPSARHQVDRIDPERGYEPGNVRWLPAEQNGRLQRRTRLFTMNCRSMPLSDWACMYGQPRRRVEARIDQHGWPLEKALTTPLSTRHSHRRVPQPHGTLPMLRLEK